MEQPRSAPRRPRRPRKNGKEIRSASLPFDRVRVSDADKARWEQAQQAKPMRALGTGAPSAARARLGDPVFPETVPAFDADTRLLVAPDSTIRIERLGSASSESTTYDVVSFGGTLVAKVKVPARTTIAGFGAGTVYAVSPSP